ncbi:MAG: hypothetical protein IH957_02500 [Chloroflexi bacterium]|nr:hypothetical protein [Chloroflexota bacterium]
MSRAMIVVILLIIAAACSGSGGSDQTTNPTSAVSAGEHRFTGILLPPDDPMAPFPDPILFQFRVTEDIADTGLNRSEVITVVVGGGDAHELCRNAFGDIIFGGPYEVFAGTFVDERYLDVCGSGRYFLRSLTPTVTPTPTP